MQWTIHAAKNCTGATEVRFIEPFEVPGGDDETCGKDKLTISQSYMKGSMLKKRKRVICSNNFACKRMVSQFQLF